MRLEILGHLILLLPLVILAAMHGVRIWLKPGSPFEDLRERLELYKDTVTGPGLWWKTKIGTLATCEFCLLTQACLWLLVLWGLLFGIEILAQGIWDLSYPRTPWDEAQGLSDTDTGILGLALYLVAVGCLWIPYYVLLGFLAASNLCVLVSSWHGRGSPHGFQNDTDHSSASG